MRVLQVAHQFLPRHRAGVEVYADGVSRALIGRGHEVAVMFTDEDGARRPWGLVDGEMDGLRTFSVANPRVVREPEDSLGCPESGAAFERVLERFRPDMVHFQHLMYVGLDAPLIARRLGIPSVMTLHEYWLLCPRGGQMRRPDGELCEQVVAETCARCLTGFRFGRSPGEARAARVCGVVERVTGWNPIPLLKRLKGRGEVNSTGGAVLPADADGGMLEWLHARADRVRSLRDAVDRFLCPSRFLMQMFLNAGWPVDRMSWLPNAVSPDTTGATGPADAPGPLRIGFMGSLMPAKGPQVLVEAHGLMPAGSAKLRLWGSGATHPDFAAGLRRQLSPGATMEGPFADGGAAEVLASMDVLVVPSIWFENAPLVILEARRAGVPVVASRLGGMAELVEDGVDGRLFEPGSPEDLARVLTELSEDRGQLRDLRRGVRPPHSFADSAAELELLYEGLVGGAT